MVFEMDSSKYSIRENNIYNKRKLDSVLYCVVYIVIPIVVTSTGFLKGFEDSRESIYWYTSIGISLLGVLYDCFSRWDSGIKSVKNTKIFFIGLNTMVVWGYCFFEIMCLLQGIDVKKDWILLIYFVSVSISVHDIICCYAQDMEFRTKVV